MAYLNVGERRIEATIAYVGPELGGKTTNFDQLMSSTLDADLGRIEVAGSAAGAFRTLRWQPAERGRFRDCGVVVKLLAQSGPFSEERVDDILRDADGVVVVIDAHPSAQAVNRASLDAVQRALRARDRAPVPVVLQVNKTDLSDALAPEDVVDALDAKSLVHVPAAAARGLGVVETLEAALAEVLAAMQATRPDASSGSDGSGALGSPAAATASTADSGHPLLAALRQVLRETMLEHVSELETRATYALRGDLNRLEEKIEALSAHARALEELVLDMGNRVARHTDVLVEVRACAESAGESAKGAEVSAKRADESATTAGLLAREATELLERELPRLGRLEEAADATATVLAMFATKDDLAAASARLEELSSEGREAVARAIEGRAKSDREHLTSLTTALRRSIEGVAQEVRASDARQRVEDATERVAELAKRSEQLGGLLADVALHSAQLKGRVDAAGEQARAMGPRIEKVDATVKERASGLEGNLEGLRAMLGKQSAAVDARIEALDGRIRDVIEELKKSKKGWFA